MPSVVVADPLPLVSAGFASLLENHGHAVLGSATTARAALTLVRDTQPDLVVLDGSLVLASGTASLDPTGASLLAAHGAVLVLGQRLTGHDVQALMRAGAGGVVDKALPVDEMLRAATAARLGRRVLCPTMRDLLTQAAIAPDRAPLDRPLTSREVDVLELLTAGASTQMIARNLHMSQTTVKTHLRNLYAKLGTANRAEAAARAVRLGLVA